MAVSGPDVPVPPADHGGFEGRHADLFDRGFMVCYEMSYRAATADPPGSGPTVYSAKRALPLEAIGSERRDDESAMYALQLGCYAGQTAAFAAAGFTPPMEWERDEFPEPPPGEHDRAPNVAPSGTPAAYCATLVSRSDLEIEIGNVRAHAERVSFEVSIMPVGGDRLRPEYQDPVPMPPRARQPDALSLSVRLPNGLTLEAAYGREPGGPAHQLVLHDFETGPFGGTLFYWLLGALPGHGSVIFACSWPAAGVAGAVEAPVDQLRSEV